MDKQMNEKKKHRNVQLFCLQLEKNYQELFLITVVG